MKSKIVDGAWKDREQQLIIGSKNKVQEKYQMKKGLMFELPSGTFFCPFCLHEDIINKFLVSTKKGISINRACCPECKNNMLMRSLTAKMDTVKYAEWVFMYSASGFWQKIKFEKWRVRLQELGLSFDFWKRYKELKVSISRAESYEEHLERQQMEYAEEYNLT